MPHLGASWLCPLAVCVDITWDVCTELVQSGARNQDLLLVMLERGEGRFAEDDMVTILPWTCFCFWDVRTYKVGELFFMYNILGFTEAL